MKSILMSQNLPDLDEWLRDRMSRWFGDSRTRRQRAAAEAFKRQELPDDDDDELGENDDGAGPNGKSADDDRKKKPAAGKSRGRGPARAAGGKGGNGDDDDDDDAPGAKGGPRRRRHGGGGDLPPLRAVGMLGGSAVLLFYLFLGFFTVDASERAVMFRLGAPAGVKGPGLRWHMPLVEDYRIVNLTEVRKVEIGYRNSDQNKVEREALMLTDNLNIIDTQFVVQYALSDPAAFLFNNRFISAGAEDVVQQAAETAMREVVGKQNIDFVLYEGREAVASDARALMQEILDRYNAGIQIREVAVRNVQPPDQVQAAFEDAIRARQDRDRKINEGEAYANNILPRAQGQAARFVEEAEGYKQGIVARALGEAERFNLLAAEYVKAPEVTRRRLYLETMEEVMGRANKVLVDDAGSNNLLYLPLDRLSAAAAAAAAQREEEEQAAAAGANGEAPPADGQQGKAQTLDEFKNRLRRRVEQGAGARGQ